MLCRCLPDQPPSRCSPPRCTSVGDKKKQPYVLLSSRADRSRSCTVASSTLRLASNPRPFCCGAVPLRPRSVAQRPRLDRVDDSCGIGDYCAPPSSLRRTSDDTYRRLRCTWISSASCCMFARCRRPYEGPMHWQGSFPSDSECPTNAGLTYIVLPKVLDQVH